MPSVEESIFIAAAPEDVFDYVQDPSNLSAHQGLVLHAVSEGAGSMRAGSCVRGTSEILGRTYDWTAEVVDYEPPEILALRIVGDNASFTISYRILAEGEGTRVTCRTEARAAPGTGLGSVAEMLAVDAYRRQMQADLATLSAILAGRRELQNGDAAGAPPSADGRSRL